MGVTVSPDSKEERPADEEGLPTGKRMVGGGTGTLHCKRSAASQQPGSTQRHRPSYDHDPPRSTSKRFAFIVPARIRGSVHRRTRTVPVAGIPAEKKAKPPPSLRRSGCGRGGPETVIGANRLACTAPCFWPATSRIRRPGSDATRPVRLACKTVHSSASRSVPLGLCALVCGSGSACASGCAPPVGCVSCVGCTFVGCTLGRTPERPAARRTRRWAHVAGVRPSFAGRLCMQTRASAGIRLLKFLFCSLSSCSLYFRCTPLPA